MPPVGRSFFEIAGIKGVGLIAASHPDAFRIPAKQGTSGLSQTATSIELLYVRPGRWDSCMVKVNLVEARQATQNQVTISNPKRPNYPMKPKFVNLLLAASIVVNLTSQAFAAPVTKENNTDALNLNSSWVGGINQPGPGDIAVWDATVNANQVLLLGNNLSWSGINMTDSGGDVTINAGNTLTLGASGFTSAANKWVWAYPDIALGVSQTWTTPNNLFVGGLISGASTLTKAGPANLTLWNEANSYSGGTTINAGSLVLGSNVNFGTGGIGSGGIIFQGGTLSHTYPSGNTLVYNNAMSVASGQSGTFTTPNRFRLNGAVSGAGSLNISINSSSSRADFQNNFSGFTGSLNITGSGSVRLGIVSLGSGQPTFNAAGWASTTFSLDGATIVPTTNSGGNTISIGALTSVGATGTLGGGTAGSPNYTIGALGASSIYAGGISGNASLTVTNGIKLTLTNTTNLVYTGTTTVSSGTLKVMGTKSGTGATSVNTGGRLSGTGIIAGTTTINSGGMLAPGDSGVGALSFSNLTLGSGSIFNASVGNSTATVTGVLTLASGATVDVNGFSTDGTYTIISYNAATPPSGAPASTALSVINGGSKAYTFIDTGSAITMKISSSDPTNYWNVDGNGTWNSAGNWTKNEIPNAPGAIAKVGPGVGGIGGPGGNGDFFTPTEFTITLDANQKVGTFVAQTDNISALTIDPGTTTPGTLSFDNGISTSILSSVLGDLIINAPVAVDADGLAVDVALRTNIVPNVPFLMTLNGVVSGSGAALAKSGSGTLVLAGNNTYDGGTVISNGVVSINSATSLGNTAGAVTFTGGTLQLSNTLAGITRSYKVAGTSNAIIDTHGFNLGYDGIISPSGGGTGGLTKTGGGTMTLSAAQTYTGATNVNGGTLAVAGGSLTNSATSSVSSAAITLSSGSLAFNGGFTGNIGNPSSNCFINLTGGTFSSSYVSISRCTSNAQLIMSPGAAGRTDAGLYINGATANITGGLNIGTGSGTNSTSTARIDSGSLTVGGAIYIQVNSPDRWSVIDVNGGTFASSDTVTGVQIGSGQTGNDAFLVRNTGVATVERFLLTQPAASTLTSRLNVSGGTLYVGSGGIVGNNNGGTGLLDIQLGTATLGAKADWSTLLGATLNGTTVIKAADAANVAHHIGIAGVVGGTGGLNKTGGGVVTLSGANIYSGTTQVDAGTLAINGNSSLATGTVNVASGAKLGGTGTIGGITTIAAGGGMTFDLTTAPASHAKLNFSDNLTFSGASTITITASAPGATTGVYTLVNSSGIISGTVPTVVLPSGWTADLPVVTSSTITIKINSTGAGGAYNTWAALYPAADLSNTAGDNDKDGLTNRQEFAFGLDPTSGSSVNPILVPLNRSTGTFSYQRRANSGLAYKILTSENLVSWPEDTLATANQSPGAVDGNGNETVVVTLTGAPLSATRLFVRVAAN